MTLSIAGLVSLILSGVFYLLASVNIYDRETCQFWATIGYILQFIALLIALLC